MTHWWICVTLIFIWASYSMCKTDSIPNSTHDYKPSWRDLDRRPLPTWYNDDKFGILLHWGVYSVPAFRDECIWKRWKNGDKEIMKYMDKTYPADFEYQEFANEFKASSFNATDWANNFFNAGAKYVILTSKHHDGYALWPSSFKKNWNSVASGPKLDLVGELSNAIKDKGMRFGIYYSLSEWFNQLYEMDSINLFLTQDYVKLQMLPEMRELVTKYKPDIIWTGGDSEAPDAYFKSKNFLAWLYNESPVRDTVVVNDRWGKKMRCKHGGFYTCKDRYNPRKLLKHKWENCLSIDKKSWGYRDNENMAQYMSSKELIEQLVSTVSCGGNILINIGPTKEGIIMPVFLERLRDIGKFLRDNGQAIYNTRPWTHQNEENRLVWYTQSKADNTTVYAIILQWPAFGILRLSALYKVFPTISSIKMLGDDDILVWKSNTLATVVHLPSIVNERCKTAIAWALEIKMDNKRHARACEPTNIFTK